MIWGLLVYLAMASLTFAIMLTVETVSNKGKKVSEFGSLSLAMASVFWPAIWVAFALDIVRGIYNGIYKIFSKKEKDVKSGE